MNILRSTLVTYLKQVAERIENNSCQLDEDQMNQLMSLLAHEPLSKVESCRFLGIGRSKFDQLVKDHKLPEGKKRSGFKELVWFKDELEQFKNS